MTDDLTGYLTDLLLSRGADLVGVGDLSALPPEIRQSLPVGISVAMRIPAEIVHGIAELPTREYFDAYNRINEQLDALVTLGAEVLQQKGFTAVAQTRAQVEQENLGVLAEAKTQECRHTLSHNSWAALPHKTVATRAGLGWIGKCALLVTETYGSAVRLSSILTNAPLTCAQPVNASRCGVCAACVTACPAAAVTGAGWSAGTLREALVDVAACRKTARQRALTGFGVETSLCGKCIEVCPYTRRGGTGKKNEGNLTPRLPLSKQ